MSQPNVLLVGTGAVGSFFGGKLAQTNVRVSALCRSDFEVVSQKGIMIQSYEGNFFFKPAEVVVRVEDLSRQPDYIIICLKALPEIDIVGIIRKVLKPQTVIVLIQNGIEIEKDLVNAFPENELISGIASIAVSRLKLGVIKHTGAGKLVLGKYPHGISKKVEILAKLFQKSGVHCEVSEKITRDRWRKMIWNASFNPISVLGGRALSRKMVEVPESEDLVRCVMGEIMTLATATGNHLPDSEVENAIKVNQELRPFKTSMLVDYENNRAMEVDAILGNAIAVARDHQIDVPHLTSLFSLMKLQTSVMNGRVD